MPIAPTNHVNKIASLFNHQKDNYKSFGLL